MTRRRTVLPALLLVAVAACTWWVARAAFRDADTEPGIPATASAVSPADGENAVTPEPAASPGPATAMRKAAVSGEESSASADAATEAPRTGSAVITLRMVDEVTGAPVPGAQVVVGAWMYRASDDGTLRFPYDPPLLEEVEVRAVGYCPVDYRLVDVSMGGQGSLPDALLLGLPPAACVEGSIRDPAGRPHGDGVVTLHVSWRERRRERARATSEFVVRGLRRTWQTAADPAGSFRIVGLPAGIELGGHARVSSWGLVSSPGPLVLQPGETRRLDLVSSVTGCVNGEVVDNLGRPVAGAHINASVRRGPARIGFYRPWARSNEQGRFRLAGVPAGQGTVHVRPPSSVVESPDDFALATAAFAITRHREEVSCRVVVHRGLTLRGRVVGPAGEPIEYVRVELVGAASDHNGRIREVATRTGAGGGFMLSPLAPGEHTVVARGFAAFGDSKPVTAKASTEDVLLQLTRACSMAGVVRDGATGAPARGRVRLWPRAAGEAERTVDTDSEGRFCFERVPAGEYDLVATTWTGRRIGMRHGIRIVKQQSVHDVVISAQGGGALRLDGADDQVVEGLVVEVGGRVVHREASVRPAILVTITVPAGRVRVRGQLLVDGEEAPEALDRTCEITAGETVTLDLSPKE